MIEEDLRLVDGDSATGPDEACAYSDRSPDLDRHVACQRALQASFSDLLNAASAGGWTEREATVAVLELAESHNLSFEADRETVATIARMRRME